MSQPATAGVDVRHNGCGLDRPGTLRTRLARQPFVDWAAGHGAAPAAIRNMPRATRWATWCWPLKSAWAAGGSSSSAMSPVSATTGCRRLIRSLCGCSLAWPKNHPARKTAGGKHWACSQRPLWLSCCSCGRAPCASPSPWSSWLFRWPAWRNATPLWPRCCPTGAATCPTTWHTSTPRTSKPIAAIPGTKTASASSVACCCATAILPLLLRRWTPEHLDRAAVLVSIAPAREFSDAERKAVHDFVEPRRAARSAWSARKTWNQASRCWPTSSCEFLPCPRRPRKTFLEPEPLGGSMMPMFISTPGHEATVHFHAAWPVEGQNAEPLVTWVEEQLQSRSLSVEVWKAAASCSSATPVLP